MNPVTPFLPSIRLITMVASLRNVPFLFERSWDSAWFVAEKTWTLSEIFDYLIGFTFLKFSCMPAKNYDTCRTDTHSPTLLRYLCPLNHLTPPNTSSAYKVKENCSASAFSPFIYSSVRVDALALGPRAAPSRRRSRCPPASLSASTPALAQSRRVNSDRGGGLSGNSEPGNQDEATATWSLSWWKLGAANSSTQAPSTPHSVIYACRVHAYR